jgi:hypothetical protein
MDKPSKQQGAGPSQALIAQRAYEIWLSQGQQPGCDQKHWFEAEHQLCTAANYSVERVTE